ncbi:MAG TPA: iron-containing alcohol dehydrogenase [Opitutaceae bacterium]|jgi:alcohol dehydrogenase YqhD (iron-dependent ADH family)|nr:iron-containing alcohol dehydrogenase [Opitutaceae bacterium]
MNSFTLYTPTRIHFGADQLDAFAQATARLGHHAFVVTGGGTIQRLGILDQVSGSLTKAGLKLTHFPGIEPNPEAATINRATAALRVAQADIVVALGGGSVIDASKAIAALAHSGENDIWPFVAGEPRAFQLKGALPIAAITTTAATASEVTPYAVISNRAAKGKSILAAEFLKPLTAWLNPVFTTGLSARTTQDGAADILSHVFENYLLGGSDSAIADRYSEGIISTVIETLPRLLASPSDLVARGNLQWTATLALNDYQQAGRKPSQFVLHLIEHALSAFRPELAHGRGLATLYPAYFRWLLSEGRAVDRLAQLGERIFGLTGTEATRAQGFITRFEQWLQDNQLYQSLEQLGFAETEYPAIAEYAVRSGGDGRQLDAAGPLPAEKIVALFRATKRQVVGSKAA